MIADRLIAWSLAFALAVFPALASAQSPQVRATVLSVKNVSSASPPVVSFVAATLGSTASATVTVASANIGNPAYISTRRVIVFIVGGSHANTLVQGSCLINGVTPDTVSPAIGAAGTGVDGVWTMSAVVPTGTTGVSVSAVFSGNMFGNIVFAIYNVDNTLLNSPIPVTGYTEVASATTGTATANSLAGGFILSGETSTNGVGSGYNVSAASETYVSDAAGIAGEISVAHANAVSANSPSSVTWSWTTATAQTGIAIAAFR